MAKDPAFLFYPGDWLGGTMGMTFEEKGAYMELLMLQFNRGHMTEDMIGQTVGHLWDNLKDKFAKDDEGLYYNIRLQEEKEKRQKYTKSRYNNLSGTNQYSEIEENQAGHTTSRMENENENKDISKDEKERWISEIEKRGVEAIKELIKAGLDWHIWWHMYGHKVGIKKTQNKWIKYLPVKTKIIIFIHTPKYTAVTFTDGKFPTRQYPYTYLNSETYNDKDLPGNKKPNKFNPKEQNYAEKL